MASNQRIQIAGSRGSDAKLIDVPSQSTPPSWKPDTTKDDFWGASWSDQTSAPSVPLPPPSKNATESGSSLLDVPIENHARSVSTKSASATSTSQQTQPTDTASTVCTTTSFATSTSTTNPRRRLPPHELEPIMVPPPPRDTTETVDRIFAYLANPPRRRRTVPDEDWERLDKLGLVEAFERQMKLARFLVRENKKLVQQARAFNGDVAQAEGCDGVDVLAWKEDEHLDVVLLTEKSKKEIKEMSPEELLDCLKVAKVAREGLLDANDEMIRQMEDSEKH